MMARLFLVVAVAAVPLHAIAQPKVIKVPPELRSDQSNPCGDAIGGGCASRKRPQGPLAGQRASNAAAAIRLLGLRSEPLDVG